MNIFINISHPAHAHFFKNAIALLLRRGHNIIVGTRRKEFTIDLLDAYGIQHVVLTTKRSGAIGLTRELLEQQIRIAGILKKSRVDLMLQISGIFNAPVGKFYGIPTLAFSDTENDRWANRISFSLSSHVFLPTCFDHESSGNWNNQVSYPGYHELAYLSPRFVSGDIKQTDNFLLRFVSWQASHDMGEKGLSHERKVELVNILKEFGNVHISSEAPLPDKIAEYAFTERPHRAHDLMRTCKLVVGESATMTSEAACLGIPAVFISDTGRGYTTEQDKKYGLIRHYRQDQWDQVRETVKKWASADLREEWQARRLNMLKEKIDVTAWMVDLIENYPESVHEFQMGKFERYYINCAG